MVFDFSISDKLIHLAEHLYKIAAGLIALFIGAYRMHISNKRKINERRTALENRFLVIEKALASSATIDDLITCRTEVNAQDAELREALLSKLEEIDRRNDGRLNEVYAIVREQESRHSSAQQGILQDVLHAIAELKK